MLGDETEILHHHACQQQKCQSKGALPEYTVCNFNLYPVIAEKNDLIYMLLRNAFLAHSTACSHFKIKIRSPHFLHA